MQASLRPRWIEQTTDALREAGRRRFLKRLSFVSADHVSSVLIEAVVDAQKALPPEDTLADDFYELLEMI